VGCVRLVWKSSRSGWFVVRKKILFWLKNKLKSTDYKTSEQGRNVFRCEINFKRYNVRALFRWQKICLKSIVAPSFVFCNYCLTIV
jgi:hypothetical protein